LYGFLFFDFKIYLQGRPVGDLFCFCCAAERTRLKEKKKQKKKSDNITPYFF